MSKVFWREASKFLAGLTSGDFLVGLWFLLSGRVPFSFLGLNFDRPQVIAWMVFDLLLLAFLIHYGWYSGKRERTDTERVFHLIAGVIFSLVALFHLSRLLFDWQLVLGSFIFPYWLNGLGVVVTALLAYLSFSLAKTRGKDLGM